MSNIIPFPILARHLPAMPIAGEPGDSPPPPSSVPGPDVESKWQQFMSCIASRPMSILDALAILREGVRTGRIDKIDCLFIGREFLELATGRPIRVDELM